MGTGDDEMDDVDRVFHNIVENRNNRIMGRFNAIPFASKNAFSTIIPGLMHKRYYLLAGPQKSGKSSLADDLFVFEPLDWILAHIEAGITIKIFYFTLEMSKEEKILSVISRLIFKKSNKIVSGEALMSLFTGEAGVLSEEELAIAEECKSLVKIMLANVEFIENTRNPFGIFKTVETYMREVGTFTYKTIDFGDSKGPQQVRDKYTKNDPNHYVVMITDHLGLLSTEKGSPDIRSAITKFSSNDCIILRNKYGVSVVNIQQMSSASQTKEYHQGSSVVEKLRPDPTALGENKTTSRDCNVMISIFNPYVYGIQENEGYDILASKNGLRDHYREIIVNLNRHGRSNVSVHMFFNGAIGNFKELPAPNSPEMANVYAYAAYLDKN